MLVPLFICGTFFWQHKVTLSVQHLFKKANLKHTGRIVHKRKPIDLMGGGEEERTLSRAGILESIADSTQH